MSEVNENPADGEMPPFAQYAEMVVRDVNSMKVDLSWLEDYDLDMIDAIESYIKYRACKLEISEGEESLYETAEDLLAYAEGVANPIAGVLTVHRKAHKKDESLFPILFFVASLGYEHGVRDAGEGRLSSETVDRIVKRRASADETRDAFREFYDDLRM